MAKQIGKAEKDRVGQSDTLKKGMETIKSSLRVGTKAVPISARISQEDAEFLAGMKIQGVTTPSEKLRVIIAETRKRQEGMQDYRSSLMMYQDLLAQVVTVTRELEMEHQVHSELVSRLIEWLPDMMAFVTAVGSDLQQTRKVESLKNLEEGITDRSFRLVHSILQMGITETCPCYEKNAVAKRMKPIVSLINVMQK